MKCTNCGLEFDENNRLTACHVMNIKTGEITEVKTIQLTDKPTDKEEFMPWCHFCTRAGVIVGLHAKPGDLKVLDD